MRSPSTLPIRSPFRSTLAPPQIAVNVQPIQTGLPDIVDPALPARKRPIDLDPFAPVPVRVGNVNFLPVIGQALGYDTNPNRTQTQRNPSVVSQTEGELGIQSDWSRHELTGLLRQESGDHFFITSTRSERSLGHRDRESGALYRNG